VGPNSGQWRTGKYSRYLPKGVAADFRRAVTDPKILQLDEDIGLLQARIAGLLKDMGRVEAPPWSQAVESLNTLVMAVRDGEGVEEALAEHARIVRTGADHAQNHELLWDKVQRTIEAKAKVSAAEWRRQMGLCVALPAAEVLALVHTILAAVEDICYRKYGNKDIYREVCRAALFHMPPEVRRAGTVVDNRPADAGT
jgi:hypothetical protein